MVKAIVNAVLIVILVLAAAAWLVGNQDAPVKDVQAAVASAKDLPNGEAIVQSFLRKHPVPTRQQLQELRDVINQEKVLAVSRTATGDPSLQPSPAAPQEVDRKEQLEQKHRLGELTAGEVIERWAYRGYVLIPLGVAILSWLVVTIFLKVRRSEMS